LVEIERNEWTSGDPLPWDIEADWQLLTIREHHRKISLELDAKKIPMRVRGEFWSNGHKVSVTDLGLKVDGETVKNIQFQRLAMVGGAFNLHAKGLQYGDSIGPSGAGDCIIISWANPRERLYKAKAAWDQLKRKRATSFASC